MPKSSTAHNETHEAAQTARPAHEIGEIPQVPKDNDRGKTVANLQTFIERYFPERKRPEPQTKTFAEAIFVPNPDLPEVHPQSAAARLVDAVVLWALLTGRRRAILVGGTRFPTAVDFIRGLAKTLATNTLLIQEWPEVCVPIRHALQIGNGGKGQTFNGRETDIEVSDERLRLAVIPNSFAFSRGLMRPVDGAFVCTGFYQPQYDLRFNPPVADAA